MSLLSLSSRGGLLRGVGYPLEYDHLPISKILSEMHYRYLWKTSSFLTSFPVGLLRVVIKSQRNFAGAAHHEKNYYFSIPSSTPHSFKDSMSSLIQPREWNSSWLVKKNGELHQWCLDVDFGFAKVQLFQIICIIEPRKVHVHCDDAFIIYCLEQKGTKKLWMLICD